MGDYCGGLLFQLNLLAGGAIIMGGGLYFGFYGNFTLVTHRFLLAPHSRSYFALLSHSIERRFLKIKIFSSENLPFLSTCGKYLIESVSGTQVILLTPKYLES